MILARIVCLLPGLMLLPSGIGWLLNPAETSIGFGFIFNDLSLAAQNALIRDLTAFFLLVPILCLISAITLNYVWVFAVSILFLIVVIAHIIAATIHGTGFIMQMFLPEVAILILSLVGAYLIAKQKS
tara:strand:+ start:168 stop:551 length:384 start_codon:yes stop_codon:yes gene_type:complete